MPKKTKTELQDMFGLTKNKNKAETPQKGSLVVIDGADGTGKKTQIDLLAETLQVSGYNHALFDFPQYGNHSASLVERYLKGEYGQLDPYAASILYAVDRFDASFPLRELLDQGKVVLANRYVTSNAGHQGAKFDDISERLKFYKWLNQHEHDILNVPRSNLNIILHIPSDIAWELIEQRSIKENRKRDLHESDREHLKRAEEVYFEITELFPNTHLIKCVENNQLLTPKQIHAKVWEKVRRIALKEIEPILEKNL